MGIPTDNWLWLLIVFIGISVALAFFAAVFLLMGFQVHLVYYNLTTIEMFEKWDDEAKGASDHEYYLSPFANFQQLFGGTDVWYLWLLPVQSNQRLGSGVS